VSVQIGGLDAMVRDADVTPGLIGDVLQVDCIVPLDSFSGCAVPIMLSAGKTSSPASLTLAIK
jgi:uncharacterized protein (TIGR03437 family)